jgi:hypothetical protein
MSSVPSTDDFRGPLPVRTHDRDLPLFRLCLRDLLVYTTFLCLVLAGMMLTKGAGAAAVLLAAMVVAAHVLSTALGSRLRGSSARQPFDVPVDGELHPNSTQIADRVTFHVAHRSSWHGHQQAGRRRVHLVILAGSLCGGITGAVLLFATISDRTSLVGVLVGAISLAVLGGWLAFLGANFYMTFRHGLREAILEQQRDESRS